MNFLWGKTTKVSFTGIDSKPRTFMSMWPVTFLNGQGLRFLLVGAATECSPASSSPTGAPPRLEFLHQ